MKFLALLTQLLFLNINANKLDDKILENTCLGKYTGVFHSFIYFSNNETSNDYYAIRTAWLLTYPDRIKKELENNNLYVYDKNPTIKCGWILRSKITNVGIYTGFIYQKNNENKLLQDTASMTLSNLYPSLEIGLTVIGCFIASCLIIVLYIFCKLRYN